MIVRSSRAVRTEVAARTIAAVLVIAAGPVVVDAATKAPATERVSVPAAGGEPDADCFLPAISADGRYVAFVSDATNLVAGDDNAKRDVFVRDRKTGSTTRVSGSSAVGGVGGGSNPTISANGRFVAFLSYASDVVPNDDNGQADLFVRDMKTGTTTRIVVSAPGSLVNDEPSGPLISGNGRFVAFSSYATNVVTGDGNAAQDVFVHDLRKRTTLRVSVDSGGQEASGDSFYPSISANGRYVAFVSRASDLVAGDTNGVADVFVRDLRKGLTTRVSVSTSGAQADALCTETAISANGRLVAFGSDATNLAVVSSGTSTQIYLHDSRTGATTRISGFTNDVEANAASFGPSMTPNGRYVAYSSLASNVVTADGNGQYDDFLVDVKTGVHTRISVDALGAEVAGPSYAVAISANGRYVAFESEATNLVSGDANAKEDVFVRAVK